MKTIKTLKDLQSMPPRVRVIANTSKADDKDMNNMVGKEFEVMSTYHKDNARLINYYVFKEEDLQVLTPIKHDGRYIGIGDEIEVIDEDETGFYTVYGFYWHDRKFVLNTVKDDDFELGCYIRYPSVIKEIKPLYNPSKSTMTDDELIAELEKRGKLVDGKVLK